MRKTISMLEAYGYRFTVNGDTVRVQPPAGMPSSEAIRLLEVLRADKPATLEALRFRPIPASEGDRHEVILADEREIRRWAFALEDGLITLDGPVRFYRRQNIAYLAYRAAMPEEWLQDAITASSKRRYNDLLQRIRKGEKWLKENEEDSRHEAQLDRFLALFDDLRELCTIVGEPLEDPLVGYQVDTS